MSDGQRPRRVIGRRELVALPDWGIRRLRAKIDTGARTSAIHVGELEDLPDGRVRFELVTRERPDRRSVWVEAHPVREAWVRPTSGETQRRLVFRTRLVIGDCERMVELGVVCRQGMLNRMLVGRTAIAGHFLVDPARKYLAGKPQIRKASARPHDEDVP